MKRLLVAFASIGILAAQKPDWVTGVQRKPFVDVREYGAKGDGVTNDTSAFQKAIDSVSVGQAVTIIIPKGTYLLSTSPSANSRYPFFLFMGEASTSGSGALPGNYGKFNRHLTLGPTHSAIPGVMNTVPGYLMGQFVDGTSTVPVTSDFTSFIFQRHNNTATGNVPSAFVFHALNYPGATSGFLGPVALTGAVSDESVGKGGVGVRSVAYMDKPVFNSVVLTCAGASPITVTVADAVPAYTTVTGVTIRNALGNLACNVENVTPTWINSTTFTIAGSSSGTYTGSSATMYVPIAGYGGWDSVQKTQGHVRLVSRESDLTNTYADTPLLTTLLDGIYEADTANVEATINTSLNSGGTKHNTIGLGLYGEPNSSYFFPLQFGVGSVRDNGTLIEARNADRIPGAGLRSNVTFAKIANNNPIKYQAAAFSASYTVLNMNASAHTILEGHPFGSIKIGPGQSAVGYLFDPIIEVTNSTAKIKEQQFLNGIEGSCDASNRGRLVMVQGAPGAADTLRICRKSAADTYAWTALY